MKAQEPQPLPTDFRPKRKDHKRESHKLAWIQQNEYDAVCQHLNRQTDASLAKAIKGHKPKKMWESKGKIHTDRVEIPIMVDGAVVRWMAQTILRERKANRKKGKEQANGRT